MLAHIHPLYHAGQPLARKPRAKREAATPAVGRLTVTEQFDRELHRCVRMAHLRGAELGIDALTPIRDATVIWMAGNCLTLAGFEVDATHRAVAQSWYVELPDTVLRVAMLYEDGGRALPRHRAVTLQPHHQGELFLQEAYDSDLRRNVRRAHLRAAGLDVVPPLRDAVVTWIGGNSLTVIGIEADPLTRKCVAQAWYGEFGAAPIKPRM